jgi:uncharacterized protein (DUF2062 family)
LLLRIGEYHVSKLWDYNYRLVGTMLPSYFKDKIAIPLLNLLKHDITPEKLALTVSVGSILAVFPVLGATTILCIIFAFIFRLNHVAIQIVNYVAYPLWAILLIPFYKIGGLMFQTSVVNLSVEKIVTLFRIDILGFIQSFGFATLYAIAAWLVICPPVAAIIYFITLPIFRKYSKF